MRTSCRNDSVWSGLRVSPLHLLLLLLPVLLPVLLVGVGADNTGSCSCPTTGFTELEQATTTAAGATPEEALGFATEINSFCPTPDSDSCVAPSLCRCGTGEATGRAAAAGGTQIICRRNKGVCVDPGANGDPHMMGLLGQTFDWAGTDGEWYSMLSDGPNLQLNVRVTAPLPEFPERQLLTAVSLIFDGGRHSLVIEVQDPHTLETAKQDCSVTDLGGHTRPCLAGGALRVLVDGQEDYTALDAPSAGVTLPDGRTVVSAANLPAECQPFGGDKVWAEEFENIASAARRRRSLRGVGVGGEVEAMAAVAAAAAAAANDIALEEWVLRSGTLAAPEWCAKFLQEEGVDGLLKVASSHAVFRIDGPAVTLRVNVGTNHQEYQVLPDGRSVPQLEFWQVDVGVEAGAFTSEIAGMLGETSRVTVGDNGEPVMRGLQVLGGAVESYRVSGSLGVDFEQLHHSV